MENVKDVQKKESPQILKKGSYVAAPSVGCNVTSESICGKNIQNA